MKNLPALIIQQVPEHPGNTGWKKSSFWLQRACVFLLVKLVSHRISELSKSLFTQLAAWYNTGKQAGCLDVNTGSFTLLSLFFLYAICVQLKYIVHKHYCFTKLSEQKIEALTTEVYSEKLSPINAVRTGILLP